METDLKNLERNVRAAIRKVVSDVREADGKAGKALEAAQAALARPIPEAIHGKTPVRGVDYLTDGEMSAFASFVLGRATPKRGTHYLTDADVAEMVRRATPVKGRDYRDGEDGKSLTWETLTPEQKDALRGLPGPSGPMPRHEWDGTKIRFEHAKGVWGSWHDLKGKDGVDADVRKAIERMQNDGLFARAGVGATRFSELADVARYRGHAGMVATVNEAEDGLIFAAAASGATWGGIAGTLSDQADLQAVLDTKVSGSGASDRLAIWTGTSALDDDSNLVWLNASDKKRLGVQVSDPQASFHAAAVVGTGIGTPTGFANVQSSEALPSAPSAAASVVAMPGAGSGGYVSFPSGSGFTGDGTTYYFRIYPCVYDAPTGVYYRSTAYEEVSGAIPNDFGSYDVSVSWGGVSVSGETVAYFVEGSTDGSSFSPIGTYASTAETFSSLSGSDATTPWPTFYKASGGTPADAPSGFSGYAGGSYGAGYQDTGASTFYASGRVWEMAADSYRDIGGTKYVSGTPTTGGFTDDNSGNYYRVASAWSSGGSQDGFIFRRRYSDDGGSTWSDWIYRYENTSDGTYFYVYDEDYSNDADAESRWGQTYSPGAQDYTFKPYGVGTSPSGNSVYSAAGSEYTASVSDTYGVLIRHALSGIPAGGAKILADGEVGYSYGRVTSASFLDAGYNAWGSGPSVTPSSYGWSGSNQNAAYAVYALLTLSGTTIESATPATLNVVNTGGVKANSLSWGAVSGATGYKVTRSINGGGTQMVSLGSGTLSLEDDALRSWSSVTTYGTAVVGVGGRFERQSTAAADSPVMDVVAYGSGNRFPKISFGVSTALGGTPSYVAHILANSSTGYLDLVAGRVEFKASLGAAASAMIGNANLFNALNSSSVHFQVNGQNGHLFATRSDQDTVGFGQAIGSDQQTAVQIQPRSSGDAALVLIGHSSMSDSSTLLRTQDSSGSFTAEITRAGWFRASTGSAANPSLSCRADTDTGVIFLGSNVLGLVTGATERVRVDSGGNVGIGTTNVTAKLDINQNSLNQVVLKYRSEATNDDPTVEIRQNRAATTDATVTTLHSVATSTNQTVYVEATVVARRTGGSAGAAGDTAAYKVCGLYKNVSGTVTLVGAVTTLYSAESQAGWDCTLDVSGTTVRVRVTGAANNNVTWHLVEIKTSPLAS